MRKLFNSLYRFIAVTLILLLLIGSAQAGLTITRSNGIATTGADGVTFINTSGIATTGADGFLAFAPNGIATTGADGIATTGADGIATTGADGIATTGADGIAVTGADGIAVTGADGIAVTGADGNSYRADSLVLYQASGIATTGADGATLRGVSGIAVTGADSFTAERANGIAVTGADTLTIQHADGATLYLPDGQTLAISPDGIAVTGADGIATTGADGIAVTGADGIATTGADGIATTGADNSVGLQSVEPELAIQLNQLTDDSNVNAVVVYHHLPTETDIAELLALGVVGGTRFRSLPMIALTATRQQLISISQLPAVRSIYGNRTLQSNADPYMALNNAARAKDDNDLALYNGGLPVSGRGVTVAVLDTGVDGTHADLAGKVIENVKLFDTQSLSAGFNNPVAIENLSNTDQLYGHGTFVAGVIAGSGARSEGLYQGVAPDARLVGLSAGDLTLSFVLSGFDYLLTHAARLNTRVVNCSFSSNTVFDLNDPVNVATRRLTDSGVNVVFSAGNTGSGLHTLNPYAVAPWVVSVGATDERGELAEFSSRGDWGSDLFHPTLVAPGVNLIAPRAVGITGSLGLISADTRRLAASELPFYTTASGTSFSAPQVAATIALMLEVNPTLTPRQVRDILQRTATPMPGYYQHEVGAGMLNIHAAVLESAFPERRIGMWRASIDRDQVRFVNETPQMFSETLAAGEVYERTLVVPEGAVLASIQIGWSLSLNVNQLELSVFDPSGEQKMAAADLTGLGLTGKRARLAINNPAAGTWRVRVKNKSLVSASPQSFSGVIELTRATYPVIRDLGTLSATTRADIYQALCARLMSPYGQNFRPTFSVTRAQLAEAVVSAGRAPQYVAAERRYSDVRDKLARNFVESAQFDVSTAIFPADSSASFRPNNFVDRLTAAIVLVRAAGLRNEAESQTSVLTTLTDILSIPSNLRGYVSVAIGRGLLAADGNRFRPGSNLSRSELAQALVKLQKFPPQ